METGPLGGKPGPCDKTCGGGVRKIKRTCTNPPPSGDGKKCKGLSIKTKSCNTQQCKLVTISVPSTFRANFIFAIVRLHC